VPGVTEDEINAIEALQKQSPVFIHAMVPSTEAFLKEDGEIGGYAALFCEWLTTLFGLQFKPELHEWGDLVAKLTAGEIHFTGEMTATEERRKTLHMSDPIANRMIKIMRIENSTDLSEIALSRPVIYAFLEGTTTVDGVVELLEPGSYKAILVDDFDTAYNMLVEGKVDAFISENVDEAAFDSYGNVVAVNFIPLIFDPVSLTTSISELAPIISIVTKALRNNSVKHLNRLYSLGYEEYLANKLRQRLTKEEREYIKNNPVVKMGAQYYNYPIDFYNIYEREWQGIIFDLLKEVSMLTGLSFEVATDTYTRQPDLLQALELGDVSFIPQLIRIPENEDRFLWSQTTKLQDDYLLISKSNFPNLKVNDIVDVRVGLIKDHPHTVMFRKWFPEHTYTVEFENIESATEALERGRIDAMMGSMNQFLSLTNYQERAGYKVNFVFGLTYDIAPGFNKDEAVLRDIMDKALSLVDIYRVSEYWIRKNYDYRTKLLQAQRPWLLGAIGLSLIILVLISILFARSRGAEKKLEKLVEQRTSELQLQAKELTLQTSLLQTMINSIPDHVFCKDLDSKYTLCNKFMAKYFNLTKDSIIGKDDIDGLGMPTDVAEATRLMDLAVITKRETIAVEEWIPSACGVNRLFVTIRAPLIQGDSVIGLIGIAHDVTERKAMEEEARSASLTKSAFLATMSHEIRTPMNSIMGFAELSIDSDSVPQIKGYLKKIADNTKWLLHIINDILDISKIESGKMELENIPFDLQDIISRCQFVVLPNVEEKNLDLKVRVESLPVGRKLIGDPIRLYQILMNLLSNAVKFTNSGTINFSSSIKNFDDDSTTVRFEIKDSGIGMTQEQTEKIFDPFTQADSSTTRNFGGTGLGLAIVKNIVELMGGQLTVESVPGSGSIFSFEIAFDTVESTDEPFDQKKIDMLEKPFFDGLVLVCDDNSMNQQVACEHLARVGVKTVLAGNGKIGVETVKERMEKGEKPFDLIFMDIFMPVMDGIEAATEIIALGTGTPIVAMTANIMVSEVEKYRDNGMPDYLGKPFTSQELWRTLLKYLTPIGCSAIDEDEQTRDKNELLKKLRINFAKNSQTMYDDIIEAIANNDITLAHRLAHTLKGNAGQLGKTDLQNIAGDIEEQLKSKAMATESSLNFLKAEFMLVVEEFKPLLSESTIIETTLSAEQIFALLEKIEPMLENMNPEAADFLDDIRTIPDTDELVNQIENYDFDAAMITLTELKIKNSMIGGVS
jgi:PAS domain S-box-containing protein